MSAPAHLPDRGAGAPTPAAAATGASRRIVRELRRTARHYGRLAAAARKGWPVRYRRARAAIRRPDAALATAMRALR